MNQPPLGIVGLSNHRTSSGTNSYNNNTTIILVVSSFVGGFVSATALVALYNTILRNRPALLTSNSNKKNTNNDHDVKIEEKPPQNRTADELTRDTVIDHNNDDNDDRDDNKNDRQISANSIVSSTRSSSLSLRRWMSLDESNTTTTSTSNENRIGELPSLRKKLRWPWENRKQQRSLDNNTTGSNSSDTNNETKNANDIISTTTQQPTTTASGSSTGSEKLAVTGDDKSETVLVNETDNPQHDVPLPPSVPPSFVDMKKPGLCIGNIFGIDVGGTLAKLAYFEQKDEREESFALLSSTIVYDSSCHNRERAYRRRASAQAVIMSRRATGDLIIPAGGGGVDTSSFRLRHRSSSTTNRRSLSDRFANPTESVSMPSTPILRPLVVYPQSRSVSISSFPYTANHPNNTTISEWNNETAVAGGDGSNSSFPPIPNIYGEYDEDEDAAIVEGQHELVQRPILSTPVQDSSDGKHHPPIRKVHSSSSDDDLNTVKIFRQESLPDDLVKYFETIDGGASGEKLMKQIEVPSLSHDAAETVASSDEHNNNNNNTIQQPNEIDQATSIPNGIRPVRRSRSMLDLYESRDHAEALDRFYSFARRLDSYRDGVKDDKLSFYSRALGGEFHFLRFETRRMQNAMDLIRANKLHLNIYEMGGTGGGAHRFADAWEQELGIKMRKQDELDSLVVGMQFVLSTVVGECYTFRPRNENKRQSAIHHQHREHEQQKSQQNPPESTAKENSSSGTQISDSTNHSLTPTTVSATDSGMLTDDLDEYDTKDRINSENNKIDEVTDADKEDDDEEEEESPSKGYSSDVWGWTRKVQRDAISYSSTYPYLVVTIGTGVSILRVDGPRKYERVSGSTIGGGTYLGLIRLLTDVDDFDDIIRLAEKGDPTKCDMMVGDIYGDNVEALKKLGLASTIVASSFGKLVTKEDPAAGLKQEDLARALLLMITNNIGQVAYLNAQLMKTSRIYFVGNFLRENTWSQRRLSYAIDYWSKGKMEALFLEHEGYFGALGAFLLTQQEDDDNDATNDSKRNRSGSSISNKNHAVKRYYDPNTNTITTTSTSSTSSSNNNDNSNHHRRTTIASVPLRR